MDTLFDLLPNSNWVNVITAVIALASAVTALTPTPAPDSALGKFYKVIELLALNFGKSKDKGVK